MEKALLIQFLEKLQENIGIAKDNIEPNLKKRAVKVDTDISFPAFTNKYISCFTELNTVEEDIKDLLNLLKDN
jgi:hypothetical protein